MFPTQETVALLEWRRMVGWDADWRPSPIHLLLTAVGGTTIDEIALSHTQVALSRGRTSDVRTHVSV